VPRDAKRSSNALWFAIGSEPVRHLRWCQASQYPTSKWWRVTLIAPDAAGRTCWCETCVPPQTSINTQKRNKLLSSMQREQRCRAHCETVAVWSRCQLAWRFLRYHAAVEAALKHQVWRIRFSAPTLHSGLVKLPLDDRDQSAFMRRLATRKLARLTCATLQK